MLGCLGLIMWALISASIIGALGGNEALWTVHSYRPVVDRSDVELQVFGSWGILWVAGVVVWLIGARIWRQRRSAR
jgi:hypothetical protein